MSEKERTLLECDVCFEKYNSDNKSPRLLLCGHTFCTECLTHLAVKGVVVCPNCRQCTSGGTKGAKELKKNFALISLLDTLQKLELGTTCDECEEKTAGRWCDVCKASFCSRCCTSIHKRALKHHKHVVLQDKAVAFCETHKNENLSFFCLECEVPICNICRDKEYGGHGAHKVNLVDRVEEDQRKKLIGKRSEIKENISSLEEISQKVSQTTTTLEANEESAENLINTTFAALFAALEERKSILLKENKSKCQSAKDKLKEQRREIAGLVAEFSVLAEEVGRASTRKGVALLLQLKSLSSRVDELSNKYETLNRSPVSTGDVSCELSKSEILNSVKSFGSIVIRDISITQCENVTATSLQLIWYATTLPEEVVEHVVQQRLSEEKQSADGGHEWKEVQRTKAHSETISSLARNTSYDFRVCGLSKLMKEPPGVTRWSAVKTFKTAEKYSAVWVVNEVLTEEGVCSVEEPNSLSFSNDNCTVKNDRNGDTYLVGNEIRSPKVFYFQVKLDSILSGSDICVAFVDKHNKFSSGETTAPVWLYSMRKGAVGRIELDDIPTRKMSAGETLGTLIDLKSHVITWDIDGTFIAKHDCNLESDSGVCFIGLRGGCEVTVTSAEWK